MKPKVLVVRAAGTNCDVETAYAFEVAGGQAERLYIDEVKSTALSDYQIITLPGGFTYGDDIAAGKILANEIKYMLRDRFLEFIEKDKLIIGICNGFQVLVKCGILPAFNTYFEEQSVSLVMNDFTYCILLKGFIIKLVFNYGCCRGRSILPIPHFFIQYI